MSHLPFPGESKSQYNNKIKSTLPLSASKCINHSKILQREHLEARSWSIFACICIASLLEEPAIKAPHSRHWSLRWSWCFYRLKLTSSLWIPSALQQLISTRAQRGCPFHLHGTKNVWIGRKLKRTPLFLTSKPSVLPASDTNHFDLAKIETPTYWKMQFHPSFQPLILITFTKPRQRLPLTGPERCVHGHQGQGQLPSHHAMTAQLCCVL